MSAAALASSPIARLRHARDWLRRGNHPDLAAVADGLDLYLDLRSDLTLDEAMGLVPAPGEEHWRTIARRAIRDDELRALADRFLQGLSATASASRVAKMIGQYEPRWRRIDCHAETMPASYRGTPDERLFRAFAAYGGKMPSARSLRRMLSRVGHELPGIDGQLSVR
jgi:hypothetical protein